MGWLRNRRTRLIEDVSRAVLAAVEDRLQAAAKPRIDEVGDVAAKMLGSMTGFLTGASELALKGAASALGQRGGRKTQANKRARQLQLVQRARPSCRLCRDPMARDLSVSEIQRHREHENEPYPEAEQIRTEDGAVSPAATGNRFGIERDWYKHASDPNNPGTASGADKPTGQLN